MSQESGSLEVIWAQGLSWGSKPGTRKGSSHWVLTGRGGSVSELTHRRLWFLDRWLLFMTWLPSHEWCERGEGEVGKREGVKWDEGRERGPTEVIIFSNLILEMTYHQPYSISHTDQILINMGRKPYKGVKTQVLVDWGPLWSLCGTF